MRWSLFFTDLFSNTPYSSVCVFTSYVSLPPPPPLLSPLLSSLSLSLIHVISCAYSHSHPLTHSLTHTFSLCGTAMLQAHRLCGIPRVDMVRMYPCVNILKNFKAITNYITFWSFHSVMYLHLSQHVFFAVVYCYGCLDIINEILAPSKAIDAEHSQRGIHY